MTAGGIPLCQPAAPAEGPENAWSCRRQALTEPSTRRQILSPEVAPAYPFWVNVTATEAAEPSILTLGGLSISL